MTSIRKILPLLLLIIAVTMSAAMTVQADPITIGSTGVAANGTPLAIGSVDPNFKIISGPVGAANAIVSTPVGGVYATSPNSQWISLQGDGTTLLPAGTYVFRTTFDLTNLNHLTARLTGSISADNFVTIRLNGVDVLTVSGPTAFFSFTSFAINSGFVAGVNTLDFVVTNIDGPGANPMALNVSLRGTADPSAAAVPEPATMMLLGTGICGIAAKLRRRKSADK